MWLFLYIFSWLLEWFVCWLVDEFVDGLSYSVGLDGWVGWLGRLVGWLGCWVVE